MAKSISRREVLAGSAALAFAPAVTTFPEIWIPRAIKPVVLASGNGNTAKNGGSKTCVARAFDGISRGEDILDAVIAGVNIVELDPTDTSVGYGGIPNADGVVQLDSCCMHGPKRWAGGVAALEGVRTPSSVAKVVAATTDHHLLVGKGAQDFARNMGFTIEADLNTATSRRIWLDWKRRIDPEHYLDPAKRDGALLAMIEEGLIDPEHCWGTIHCNAIDAEGRIAGVTTTSGLAFKIPGRVGDSPILGAGLYVDGAVGAAGSTGRGEANLYNLSSFLVIEELRRGKHPKDAGLEALRRVVANTTEKRLLDEKGRPKFGLQFYIVDAKGRYAGVALAGSPKFAVCDEDGPRHEICTPLLT